MYKYFVLFLIIVLFLGCFLDESDEFGWYSDSIFVNGINGVGGLYINYDVMGEQYVEIIENFFIVIVDEFIFIFFIDVDGVFYSNVCCFLNDGIMLFLDVLCIEEFINYFDYDYFQFEGLYLIGLNGEVSCCFWVLAYKLICIGIKGQIIEEEDILFFNLVFLIDVLGFMGSVRKLLFLQEVFKLLVQEFIVEDWVVIVIYVGQVGVVLFFMVGDQIEIIINVIEGLIFGGSIVGVDGINIVYEIVLENYIEEGNNWVILVIDGDFNVGLLSIEELV